jgi:hypothetical protein
MDKIWTPKKRLSYLPDFPRNLFITEAELLYKELLENKLLVGTCPAPDPKHADHKIRVVESRNPEWYSLLYDSHNRRSRRFFEKALWRITNNLDGDLDSVGSGHYIYDTCFRDMIYTRLVEGYIEKDLRVFPNNEVRNFFGLDSIVDEDFIANENYKEKMKREMGEDYKKEIPCENSKDEIPF